MAWRNGLKSRENLENSVPSFLYVIFSQSRDIWRWSLEARDYEGRSWLFRNEVSANVIVVWTLELEREIYRFLASYCTNNKLSLMDQLRNRRLSSICRCAPSMCRFDHLLTPSFITSFKFNLFINSRKKLLMSSLLTSSILFKYTHIPSVHFSLRTFLSAPLLLRNVKAFALPSKRDANRTV